MRLSETDHAFAEFLRAKAAPTGGFKTQEVLKYRCGQIAHVAQGLWSKVVGSDLQVTPMRESDFYQKCCVVQACYQKCTQKRSRENFEALKEAYEDVLALAGGDAQQHDHINAILDRHFAKGKSVGTAVLQYKAYRELLAKDGSKISGRDFLTRIEEAYKAGYRGKVEESEARAFPPLQILRTPIKQMLTTPFAGLFLPYARVYKRHAEENGGTLAALHADKDTHPEDRGSEDQASLSGQVVFLLKKVSKSAL